MTPGLICEKLEEKTGKYWGVTSENEYISSESPFTNPRKNVKKYTYEQVIEMLKSFENNVI